MERRNNDSLVRVRSGLMLRLLACTGFTLLCGANYGIGDDSVAMCAGTQTASGPNISWMAGKVCDGQDCTTPKRTLDAIARWIQLNVPHKSNCGQHRFALAAEQLIGPAETPGAGQPWVGHCFSGCTQYGLMFTALAEELGIHTQYIGTLREDAKDLLEAGTWPNPFPGHYFTMSWTGDRWVFYDPAARHIARFEGGAFTKVIGGVPYRYYVYAIGCDPWSVGIHNPTEVRQHIESLFCPGGHCN